jgi:hypothetical protein
VNHILAKQRVTLAKNAADLLVNRGLSLAALRDCFLIFDKPGCGLRAQELYSTSVRALDCSPQLRIELTEKLNFTGSPAGLHCGLPSHLRECSVNNRVVCSHGNFSDFVKTALHNRTS